MGFSRQEYWSGLPFPSPVDHILSELYIMTHLSWVALHGMDHSFIELDKAVVHVIRLTSFLCLWFVCLPSDACHNTCHLTWVSLTLDVGYLFRAAPAKHSCCSLPWMRGIYLLTIAPPDLERGVAPLGPPAPMQPPFLGREVELMNKLVQTWQCNEWK